MMDKKTYFLCILLLLCLTNWVAAQPIVLISKTSEMKELSEDIFYWEDTNEDKNKTLKLNDILQATIQAKFKQNTQSTPNFHITTSTIWLKFLVQADTKQEIVAEITNPTIEDITLFVLDKNGNMLDSLHTGTKFPFSSKSFETNFFVFPIAATANEPVICYLKLQSNYPMQVPIHVGTLKDLLEKIYYRSFLHTLYFGVMFLVLFFNIVMFFHIREKTYLYYLFYVLFNIISIGSIKGYGFQFLWTNYPVFNQYTVIIFALTFITIILFSISFLHITKKDKFSFYALCVLLGVIFLGIICNILIDVQLAIKFSQLVALIGYIFLFVLGFIKTFYEKQNIAKFYFAALGFYILGVLGFLLVINNVLPHNEITSNLVEIGSVIEILLLSFGLGDKVRLERLQREQINLRLLDSLQVNEKIIKEQNDFLEKRVAERTEELEKAGNKLLATHNDLQLTMAQVMQQKEEIEAQRDMLEGQKHEIQEQHNDIKASIQAALRIQNMILPTNHEISSVLSHNFVFYKPRDVVSGDFYWLEVYEKFALIAAVDCTGHGVPGAFMSFLGHQALKEIFLQNPNLLPNQILEALDIRTRNALREQKKQTIAGMEVALCRIDLEQKKVQYAGAMNPLYYVQEENLVEIKADKRAIGGFNQGLSYTMHEIDTSKPTMFYLCSDGFQDQFGGKEGRKFMVKQLKNLLFSIHSLEMEKQQEELENTFNDWKGRENQVDDVLVIGFRI